VGEGLAVESLDPPPASGGPGERGREARGQTGRGFGAHSGRKPDIARSPKSAQQRKSRLFDNLVATGRAWLR